MVISDDFDHVAPRLTGTKEGTFAYKTVKDRWPKIVTGLVDQLSRRRLALIEEFGPEVEDDMKYVLERFSKLRYEIMTDKPVELPRDGFDDSEAYWALLDESRTAVMDNEEELLTWFKGPWLFVECVLYRFLFHCFYQTQKLKNWDYFEESKRKNFTDHLSQIEEAAAFIMKICAKDAPVHELFGINTILKMSLWGNRADMSLTGGADSTMEISSISASSKLSEYVLIDDVNEMIVKVLAPLREDKSQSSRRIDIILDNAGVELSGDLMLAEFLIARGFADVVHLHGKAIPWFVSDVTERDFQWTLDSLETAGEESRKFGEQLKKRLADGQLIYSNHLFWTSPHPYFVMDKYAEDLHNELKTSSLAIFKGDLNYRKLVGDRDWDLDTSFKKACRGFAPCPFMALRTLKAETVAGLGPETIDRVLEKFEEDNSWMTSGEYAVCQLGGI